jgi:radical SAM protein with 4Fe4S-binding SPASM domain
MDMSLFVRTLDEIKSNFGEIKLISFAAYNEPTADPHFIERLKVLSRKGFRYFSYTNGSLLTEDLIDRLADHSIRITGTYINLPTLDKSEYKKIVGREGDPRKILEMVIYLAKKIPKRHHILVNGDKSLEHRLHYNGIRNAVKKKKNIRVKQIKVIDRAGMLEGPGFEHVSHKGSVIGCASHKLNNLYIGVNGEVYLCCNDYHKRYSFGNIGTTSLNEMLEDRSARIAKMFSEFCINCGSAEIRQEKTRKNVS